MQILQRINRRSLDCAILPMPIDNDLYYVQQVAQSPLVICLRGDDPLALQTQLDIQEIALRIKIFRDPELQPSAHSRLVEMFEEVGTPLHLACSATTPAQIQWMIKAGYGLAFIDQTSFLDSGELDDQNGVLGRKADEHYQPDLCEDVVLQTTKVESQVSLQDGNRGA
jgi:DNA-binding transcriptional LysR family regulator